MRGTGIFALGALIIAGTMVGDILAHPTGTKAAGGVITGLWTSSLQGVAGQKIS